MRGAVITAVTALALCWTALAAPVPQLAGVGAASDSIFTDTDNGVGYGIENAEDQLAGNVGTVKGVAAAPAPALMIRQLNKVVNGAGTLGNAAGVAPATNPVVAEGDEVDDQSTNDIANLGAQAGSDEETTLEQAGTDVP